MNEGWWINYKTRHYVVLHCRGIDHESSIRGRETQAWLDVPPSVVREMARFKPVEDRDALLLYLIQIAPLMRARGHGEYVTFEYCSENDSLPFESIRRWVKDYAGPSLLLQIVNLTAKGNTVLRVLPHQFAEMLKAKNADKGAAS